MLARVPNGRALYSHQKDSSHKYSHFSARARAIQLLLLPTKGNPFTLIGSLLTGSICSRSFDAHRCRIFSSNPGDINHTCVFVQAVSIWFTEQPAPVIIPEPTTRANSQNKLIGAPTLANSSACLKKSPRPSKLGNQRGCTRRRKHPAHLLFPQNFSPPKQDVNGPRHNRVRTRAARRMRPASLSITIHRAAPGSKIYTHKWCKYKRATEATIHRRMRRFFSTPEDGAAPGRHRIVEGHYTGARAEKREDRGASGPARHKPAVSADRK